MPVPLPFNIPESVVEPVPPFAAVSAVASVRAPAELNDEVAEPPKYAVPNTESCVVDAPAEKSCSALHVFAVVVPKASEIVFEERRSG